MLRGLGRGRFRMREKVAERTGQAGGTGSVVLHSHLKGRQPCGAAAQRPLPESHPRRRHGGAVPAGSGVST